MKKKLILSLLVVACIFSVSQIKANAAITDNSSNTKNISLKTDENLDNKDCNIMLGGELATDGVSTFYVKDSGEDFTQSIHRCSNDGSSDVEILGREKNIQYDCLNICGDYIYYRKIDRNITDPNFGESLYRIKKDGSEKTEIINNLQFRNMQIKGNYIYLEIYSSITTRFGEEGFYKFNLDGTLNKMIMKTKDNGENCYKFDVIGDYAYFVRSYQDQSTGGIWMRNSLDRINLDGTNRVHVIDDTSLGNLSFGNLINDGEYLYYTKSFLDANGQGSNGIYKIKKDGTDEKEIYDGSVYNMNLSDGWIYCYSPDKQKILRMKNDGTEVSEIGFQGVFNTGNYIAGDWIYYDVLYGSDFHGNRDVRLNRTKIDGSRTEVLK